MGTKRERPEGYRTPGHVEDGELAEVWCESAPQDAPLVRLVNALLIDAVRTPGTVLRFGTHPRGRVERRATDGGWESALDRHDDPGEDPQQRATMVRRVVHMAKLPDLGREATMGFIHLRLGVRGSDESFAVFVRPCGVHHRVIVRHLVPAQIHAVAGNSAAAEEAAATTLRWEAEEAFRFANGPRPLSALGPLAQLADAAERLGAGGDALSMRACWALGGILLDQGRFDEALGAFERGRRAAARRHGGGGPAVAELLERGARALAAMGRFDDALRRCAEAIEVTEAVYADELLLSELHGAMGDILRDAGRPSEAARRYDEAIAILTDASGPDDDAASALRQRRRALGV